MIKIVHGDLMESSAQYICHQVNCQGVMGSGVAKQIREKWPDVYNEYVVYCKGCADTLAEFKGLLGAAQFIHVDDDKIIVNIFGQEFFGKDGRTYTNHEALLQACETIAQTVQPGESIAMPYRIGCGLGGGDWGLVMDMLTTVFKDHHLTLYKKS